MKLNGKLLTLALLSLLIGKSLGQGFINLNFENVTITPTGETINGVVVSNATPGWTTYYNDVPIEFMLYETLYLSVAQVSLHSTNGGFTMIEGNYFVLLRSSLLGQATSAAIGQTGLIQTNASSVIFWGVAGATNLTFNGQILPTTQTGSVGIYGIYAADISPYAGQTGHLRFTSYPVGNWLFLDNIQFSTAAVPEPSTLGLVGLGGFGLAFVRKLRSWHSLSLCSKD